MTKTQTKKTTAKKTTKKTAKKVEKVKKSPTKHAYRVIWTETYTCSKIVEATSREEALRMCHDIDDPDTCYWDGNSEWGCEPLPDED